MALMLSLAAFAGCASSQAAREQPGSTTTAAHAEGSAGHEHGQQGGMMEMCPMRVLGTTVSVSDTEGGVAIAFKTTGDVAELRRRVGHMAQMHNRHHAQGSPGCCRGMMGGEGDAGTHALHEGRPGMMGMSHGQMVPATAAAEDVEGGARIVLTPKDASQLDALRSHVHAHAERMSRGECPMMVMQGQASSGGDGR